MPKPPTGFEQMYPNIAEWVNSYHWIEIGDDGQSSSFVRALNEGGLVWENDDDDATLDEVLEACDAFLAEQMANMVKDRALAQTLGVATYRYGMTLPCEHCGEEGPMAFMAC